jgi:predicted cupin superfamily sugar epimerase
MDPRAQHWIDRLGLVAHPEGGRFREMLRDEAQVLHPRKDARRPALTHIHFLLERGDFSALHRVAQTELWHHVDGGPVELTVLHEGAPGEAARVERVVLGRGDDEQLVHAVPPLAWQAAVPLGAYVLCGCTVAPGFAFDDFELPSREVLLARFPEHRDLVTRLTRSQ